MRGEPAPAPPEAAAAAEADEDEEDEHHYTRNVFLAGATLGHRRRDRRRRRRSRRSASRSLPAFVGPGVRGRRPRAARQLPRGPVDGHEVQLRGRPARGRRHAAPPTSATTARCRTASRASRSSRTAASTSAARCSRPGSPRSTEEVETEGGAIELGTTDAVRLRAARATAAPTTSRATASPGPPVRALDRYEYSIVDGNLVARPALQRRRRSTGDGRRRRDDRLQAPGPGHARRRPRAVLLPVHPVDGEATLKEAAAGQTRPATS